MPALYSPTMRSCSRPLSRPRSSARLGLASAFSCLLLIVAGEARGQAPPPADAPSPIVQAARALRTGHYDEIESLTASLSDEASQQVRAQAHVARGRYAQAIAILTPFATAEPAGASALELGLLYRMLGRTADATRLLTTVVERSGRNQDQESLVRAARAARALSRFEQANESTAPPRCWASTIQSSRPAGANCSSRSRTSPKRSDRSARRCRRPRLRTRARGARARVGRQERAGRAGDRRHARSRSTPRSCRRTSLLAELALDDADRAPTPAPRSRKRSR